MNCKNCKTRIPARQETCPNCGRRGGGLRPATPEAELSRDTLASSQPRLSLQGVAEVDLDQLLEPDTADLAPALSPVELRERLARQPELLEAGLSLHEGGSRATGNPTEVGEIDLVLSDEKGDLSVVLIPEKADLASALYRLLPRMGYVARAEGRASARVRGIVLLPSLPDTVDYAVAAVADRVRIYTYRASIRFDRMELGEPA